MVSLFDETNIEGVLGIMVPIIAIVGGISLAFGIVYLRSKERLELISRGVDISKLDNTQKYLDLIQNRGYRGGRRSPLRRGLVWLGVGLGLLSAYYVSRTFLPEGDHPVIYFGFVGLFVGSALILAHLLEKKEPQEEQKTGI